MDLKIKRVACFVAVMIGLVMPVSTQASEEKPVSLEAIMEELANLRSLVEAQQRQIDSLQALVEPQASGRTEVAAVQQTQPANVATPTPQELSKRVDTLSSYLGGFKL